MQSRVTPRGALAMLRGAVTDSRTYEATPRRLARARQQLGRPSSYELAGACALGVAAIALPSLAASLLTAFRALWGDALAAARSSQLPATAIHVNLASLAELARLTAAGLAAVALTAGAVTGLQRGVFVRFLGAGESGREASVPRESALERVGSAAFSLAKWSVLIAVLIAPWSDAVRGMLGVWQRAPHELSPIAGELVLALLERAAIALAMLGVIDLGVQQLLFRRRLKMSRHELQEERRATEADPHASAERRRRARELQTAATLQELDDVTSVVCDLEGRAIALRETAEAIAVWITAAGDLAARLRAEAIARGVPVVVDVELSAALAAFEINEPLTPAVRAMVRRYLVGAKLA
jgi:flagellar biosynthesis protein FlhB